MLLLIFFLSVCNMTDTYYVGESAPPPLPPPRKPVPGVPSEHQRPKYEPFAQYDTFTQYDTFDPVSERPPLPPPNAKQPPPLLPRKQASFPETPSSSMPKSPTKIIAAISSSVQSSITKRLTSKNSPERTYSRASSVDAHVTSPLPPPPLPQTRANQPYKPKPPAPPPPVSTSPPPTTTGKGNTADDEDLFDYEDVEFSTMQIPSHPSDGISLLQFINQNQETLPAAFEVSLGFSACSEEASISEGERFIANFLKRCKVLSVEDDNKELYSIPLNTSFQFALLHDPNMNKKEAMTGFVFKTAGELMISRSLPKVIRARKAFRGVSPESSVAAKELLYVKEVVHKEGNRRYVKCVQASTGKEKQLHEECNGEFSTSPHDIREYLPNLLKHFQLPFKAVMCLGIDNEEDIPSHLVSAVVTLSNLRTEESLIAATIVDDSDTLEAILPDNNSIILNDIPLSYDINVKPLHVKPMVAEKMIEQTEFILQNFNPAKVFPYLANHSSSQLALMKSVRKEMNMHGIELMESKLVKKRRLEKEAATQAASGGGGADLSKVYQQIQELETRLEKLEKKMTEFMGSHTKVISGLQQQLSSVMNNQQSQ